MRAIVPRLLARSLLSSFSGSVHTTRRAMASTEHNSVEAPGLSLLNALFVLCTVCFLDPRTVLQRENLQGLLSNEKLYTRMAVPTSLLPVLSQGVMELGDADDPMNSWFFGQKEEIFKYRLIGQHPTMSGFTCIIEREQLAAICDGSEAAGLPDWEEFKADLQEGLISFPSIRTPFLFAGTVLDAPAAAVYSLKQDGQVVGVAIHSEAA